MNICEDKIKVFLDRLLPLQESELYTSNYFFLNPLSRYAHVYICEKCWMDEALRELDRQPIPLRIWSASLPLVLSGELPSSMNPTTEGPHP